MADDSSLKHVIIYTDGAAEPNPGPAGYGVVLKYGGHRKELSGGFEVSTNNRMELLATIVGLEALTTECRVTLHSDSKYVVESVNNGSVFRWRENDWFRTRSSRAKNADLWKRFLAAYEKHAVTLVWVKGHAAIPENEQCDQLAVAAAQAEERNIDLGYAEADEESRSFKPAIISGEPRQGTKHKEEGEPCRKCGTPVEKRIPRKKRKARQSYYFEWYLYCPGCKAMYMVEEAKRIIDPDEDSISTPMPDNGTD